ncbi:type 4a pilus biogenesis protein PilO [uncultured Azohydromonas sp.]|jgi:Tfp pilus assembly protein PilO|uniref:type 4a pilus biogenesis protein PilO n=1 Tax=uncultured Azohydromonas sp. TaxID=487342 RepID=UPI0026371DCD|nr:type 4a pilus biogenesis protein PilO [uncultured Azohydromonas sp.]
MSLPRPSFSTAARLAGAFHGLDWRNPALWPPLPRGLLCALVALGVALPAWGLLSASAGADLAAAREREPVLRRTFTAKLAQAAQLAPLQRRRQELQDLSADLEHRLPPPGQLETLLSALHQAAQRHGLQVELIRPEPAQTRAHLAEVPIALRLSGRFHALGAFAADVAALETPVTLQALQLGAGSREATTTLEASARAWHRRDPAEALRPAATPGATP